IDGLRLAEDGGLLIQTAVGELKESAPTIYQDIEGVRVAVSGRFKVLNRTSYTFEVGPHHPNYALVIDPTLVYAAYLGGTGSDSAEAVTVDDGGRAYVAGSTTSVDFPTVNGLQGYAGGRDIFVARLNPAGTTVEYSTFFGGAGDDFDPRIAI